MLTTVLRKYACIAASQFISLALTCSDSVLSLPHLTTNILSYLSPPQLLQALRKVGRNLDDHLHLVLPPIVRLFDPKDAPPAICQEALVTVADLATKLDLTEYVGRIMHPLVGRGGGGGGAGRGVVGCMMR